MQFDDFDAPPNGIARAVTCFDRKAVYRYTGTYYNSIVRFEIAGNSQEYFTACSKVLLVCKPQHHGKVRLHSLRFRGLSQDTSGRPTMSQ